MSINKLDTIALTLSVIFTQFFFNFFRMKPIDWNLIVVDLIIGIMSYWIAFLLFRNTSAFLNIPSLVCSVILGSILLVLGHSIYIFYFDWRYLSTIRQETFYDRNLNYLKLSLLYLLPVISIIAFLFVFMFRALEKIIVSLFFRKGNS